MTTAYTSLLGLALPVQGELTGVWGDTVNNSITSLLDTSVAGTTNVSTDTDVTLTTTTGAANTARQAILLFSGARTALRTVTAPAQSKVYTVINATTGGYSVKLVGSGPTTGLTIPNGASAVVAWNGSDFVEVGAGSIGNLVVNGTLTVTGATTLQSTLAVTGNITNTAGTANGVAYLNGSKVVTSGSALTFDGTNLALTGTSPIYKVPTAGGSLFDAGGNNGIYILGSSNYVATFAGGAEQMRLTSSLLTVTPGATIQGLTVGRGAGAVSTNTAVGASALAANTSGSLIVAVGTNALAANTSGAGGTALGREALKSNTTGDWNIGIGVNALTTNTTGSNNVAIGQNSLQANTTASNNTAVGYQAGYSNTTGANNTAVGYHAGYSNTTGPYNIFIGSYDATGYSSGFSNTTGGSNVALGNGALSRNTTASNNTAVGYQAGYSKTTGGENAFFGSQSGYAVTTGVQNTFVGEDAGSAVTTGSKNAILGSYNGNQGGLDIRTASNYIVLSDGDGNPRAVWNSSGRATTLVWQADAAYSNNYTYSSGWATTFQTLLPGGTFSITSTFLVTINLELDGAPYYCDCSFLWKPVSTNGGAGTSLAFIPGPTATHVGSGEYWTVRSTCPSSSSSGLQAQLTGGNTGLSGVVRVKVALIAGY